MSCSPPAYSLLSLLLLCCLLPLSHSHGFISIPNPRGYLDPIEKFSRNNPPIVNASARTDTKIHFPAGNKDPKPGSGARSQIIAAGPKGWTPFTPLSPSFRWRAGLCGDLVSGTDHMRGGEYYNGAQIAAEYQQGGIVDVSINIIAHHGGFMELHVCDVDKCGGEISEACFRNGHCAQLQRAPNAKCDSGNHLRCAPIDPAYPGRWYFPCTDHHYKSDEVDYFGGDSTILYTLPSGFVGPHLVLQWFWSAANTCNPPGVIAFHDSDKSPKWGQCRGQGGALGGVARVQRACDSDHFPEEYLQCIDIRITPKGGAKSEARDAPPLPSPSPTKTPKPSRTPRPDPSVSSRPSKDPAPSRTSAPSASAEVSKMPSTSPSPSRAPRPSRRVRPSRTPSPSPEVSKMPSTSPASSRTPTPSRRVRASLTPSPSPLSSPMQSRTPVPSMEASPSPSLNLTEGMADSTVEPSPEFSPEVSMEVSPEAEVVEMGAKSGLGNGNVRDGLLEDVVLVADGKVVRSVYNGDIIDIDQYSKVAFEAVVSRNVDEVQFFLDGELVWTDYYRPYFMFGNSKRVPRYWNNPVVNRVFELTTVVVDGGNSVKDVVNVRLVKSVE